MSYALKVLAKEVSNSRVLFILSQSNQAARLADLLESAAGKSLWLDARGHSSICVLTWAGTKPFNPSWSRLQKLLEVERFLSFPLPRNSHFLSKATKRKHLQTYNAIFDFFPNIERVVWFSYLSHYTYGTQLAATRGVPQVLIEEGLGTYAALVPTNKITEPNSWHETRTSLKKFGRTILNATNQLTLELRSALQPPTETLKVMPDGFREFDEIYTSYSRVATKLFPDAKLKHLSTFSELAPKKGARTADCLFVGQTYELDARSNSLLLKDALLRCNGRLLIRRHPRASEHWLQEMQIAISELADPRISWEDSDLPMTELLAEGKFEQIFSLTSSVLIESRLSDPGLHTESLAPVFLERAKRRSRVTAQIKRDFEILRAFSEASELAIN